MYYVVKFAGEFGFIKPWTAVRDGKTFSQQFLTPSIVEGIEKKLFPELLLDNGVIQKIIRHKLTYSSIDIQQEQTQARGWKYLSKTKTMMRERAIIDRGIMINPILYLAFENYEDASIASQQHICLCRNEDIMLPDIDILNLKDDEFNNLDGFELRFGESKDCFIVGYNRYNGCQPMYGWLEVSGKSVLSINEQT